MVNYPSDWNNDIIDNIADVNTGIRDTQDRVKNGRYPFFIRSSEVQKLDEFDYDCEAVLTVGDGQIGKIFHYVNGKFSAHQRVYVMSNFKKITGKYFFYNFSRFFYNEVMAQTAKTTVDSVRKPMITEMTLRYPADVKEQKIIVKALDSFDKHIEKKKMIRDGAVEDLVSGKKRLSNFSGKWDYKPVKSITKDVITGGTPSTNIKEYWGGGIPWLASTEIHQKNIRNATKNISDLGLLNSSAKIAPKDSVLIALAGQGKTRGTAAILGKNMAINQSLAALVCNEDNYYKFLFYAIEMNYEALRELSSGDGGRGGLNKKLIKDFKINIPSDKNEQIAIADILSSMDKEIESLEKEKEKYLQLKSGAMDDLLTGKIRLV